MEWRDDYTRKMIPATLPTIVPSIPSVGMKIAATFSDDPFQSAPNMGPNQLMLSREDAAEIRVSNFNLARFTGFKKLGTGRAKWHIFPS